MKTFFINGRSVSCEIKRSRRKTVALYVHPDKRVEIRMPLFCSIDAIEPFLIKHSRWLFNRLDASEKKTIEPKKFVSGELHYFLGKQYPIEVNPASKNSVVFKDDIIYISRRVAESPSRRVAESPSRRVAESSSRRVAESPSHRVTESLSRRVTESPSHRVTESLSCQDVVEKLLDCWYLEQAKRVFKECAEPLIRQMAKYNVAPSSFTIRKMKTRWGSCSRKGSISLNLHLIKLPEQCIKEVILHELCHLVHFNHSKEFYALMTAEMPDWKNWKKELKFL